MKRRFRALALASMAASTCASAETNNVTATGFTVTQAREVNAPPEKVWASLTHVEDWWSGAHTWSGKASNLSFDLRAGGCWCEKWEGASVLHGTVAFIQEGKVLRFYANLGPLQDRATNGVLTFALGVAKEKTMLKVIYRVAGAPDAGLQELAPAADKVIGEQVGRLVKLAETGKAD